MHEPPIFHSKAIDFIAKIFEDTAKLNKKRPPANDGRPFKSPSRERAALETTFLDTGFLTGKFAQVEDTGATDNPALVHFHFFDERRIDGEYPFHTDIARHLAHRESSRGSAAATLQYNALELLDTLLVTFFNLITYSYGVASFESRQFIAFCQCINKLH